jgi:muramoyltetrapeptide carboxypeptidase
MISPQSLMSGDLILIVSPAKAIAPQLIKNAQEFFRARGYRTEIGAHASGQFNYFSGTDEERQADMQWAIDHPEAKAIWCARGGYGAIRIIEKLQWASMLTQPKWLIGFSDITNFHCKLLQLSVESIHGTMPLNFAENSDESFKTLFNSLETNTNILQWKDPNSINGQCTGETVGGNFSILYSLLGTPICPNFSGKILFLEDLAEQWYHIDRMFESFALKGVFEQISGLILGGFTEMKDTAIPTNFNLQSIVERHFLYRKIPIVYNASLGHMPDNQAIIVGRKSTLSIQNGEACLLQENALE